MHRLLPVLACLLTSSALYATPGSTLALLEGEVSNGRVQSAAIGFFEDDALSFHGMGQLSRLDATKPTPQTVYEIGSISKVFTALMALQLVDDQRLELETTLADHFTDHSFDNDRVAQITVLQLLTHRSGLPRMPSNFASADPLDPYVDYTRQDLLDYLTDVSRIGKPDYAYSNLGMGVAGTIVADRLGLSYGTALRVLVTEPLAMRGTTVKLTEAQKANFAPGHSSGAMMPSWNFDSLAGAGAIRSSVADLTTFLRAQLNPPRALEWAIKTAMQPTDEGKMGLGWHIKSSEDRTVYWHNGGTGGYASFLGLEPATGRGVIILTASTEYDTVTRAGFSFFGTDEQPHTDVDPTDYVGSFAITDGFILRITNEGGQLYSQATGQGRLPINPTDNKDEFRPSTVDAVIEFHREGSKINALTLHQGGQTMRAPRVSDDLGPAVHEVIDIDTSLLADYVGEYSLNMLTTITVTQRDSQLFAQVSGQPAFPVFPYATDRFFYRVVDAQLEFLRNEEGRVDGLKLHQNGVHEAARK